jgi:hypothetical protein
VYSRVSAQYAWIQSNVCAFSKSPPEWFDCEAAAPVPTPTPTPTLSPIPENKHNLLIVVTLDVNPTETGWRLSTLSEKDDGADEAIIFDMPVGSYDDSDAGATFQYDVVVDIEQFYNMTIYDTMGNGFGGTVLVSDLTTPEMSVLTYEPGFTAISGTIVSHGFYVGSSPPQYLTLELIFDVFPNEMAFEITNDDDGIIFALAWFGTFDTSYTSATAIIPIYGPSAVDRGYTLRIWDSNNDGICCQWGDGRYDLYLGDPGAGGTFLGGGSGNYGAEGTFPFVVVGDSSLAMSLSTSLPSSVVPMMPSNKPTLRPAVLEPPQEDARVPSSTSGSSSPTHFSSAPTLRLTGGMRPMKDDALAPSVNDNHGGAFLHESDGTNTESDKNYDTSASARSRIHCAVQHVLIFVASSSLLMHS